MADPPMIPFSHALACEDPERLARSRTFRDAMASRRTVREYRDDPVDAEVLRNCVAAAATAPSGANRQPWHFVVITDPEIKRGIRIAAEKEEEEFYGGRAPDAWLQALQPFGTNAEKPFLETAPALIAIFAERFSHDDSGARKKNYYVQESVGIATGILITALHQAGLATLTHTPSPMGFLNEALGRPSNEAAFLLLVVGHPAHDARVPDIERKPLGDVLTVYRGK